MEFESNQPQPSDEYRKLAAMKKVTLAPLHTNVTPEEDTSVKRSEDLTPIANITIDQEDTASREQLDTTEPAPLQQAATVQHSPATASSRKIHWPAAISAVIVCLLFAGVVYAVWSLRN